MRQVLIAWMVMLLVIAGVGMASADEGILILPDGQAKYFKDGEFVSFAYPDGTGKWFRSDTREYIGMFFDEVPKGDGRYRGSPEQRATRPIPEPGGLPR